MNFMLQKQWALTKTNIVYHEGQIMELEQHGLGVWCIQCAINFVWRLSKGYHCEPSVSFFYTWSGMKINVMTTELQPIACKHEPECSISNWNWHFSSCCLGQQQISHSHNDTNHNTRLVFSFTFESIFNFSLIHSQPMSSKTLSLAKISFWQTMQWIKGHTWPLSCSLGDQTHFQGQELLTSLFNQGGETRNLR